MTEQWQKDQAARCACKGTDELCRCQNVRDEDELVVVFAKGIMTDPQGVQWEATNIRMTFTRDRR